MGLMIDRLKICIISNWKETKYSSGLMVIIIQLMIHSIDVKAKMNAPIVLLHDSVCLTFSDFV